MGKRFQYGEPLGMQDYICLPVKINLLRFFYFPFLSSYEINTLFLSQLKRDRGMVHLGKVLKVFSNGRVQRKGWSCVGRPFMQM